MKRVSMLVTMLLVAILLLVTLPAQAKAHPPIYLEKVCDGSVAPNICVIQNAAHPFAYLNGGTIEYFDHAFFQNPAGIVIESATVLLTAGDGSQAPGHVRWINDSGYFTFLPGTGSLEKFHAVGQVNVISWDTATFSLTGEYFFTR